MKKAIALLGCITVCLSLAACKGNDDPVANIKSSIPSPTSSTSSGVLTSISDSSDAATSDSTSSDISSDTSSKSTSSKNKTNTGKKNNTSSKSSSKPSSKPSSSVSNSSNTNSEGGMTLEEYIERIKSEMGDEEENIKVYASGNSVVIETVITDEELKEMNEDAGYELSRDEISEELDAALSMTEDVYKELLKEAKKEVPEIESFTIRFVDEKGGVFVSRTFK